MPAFTILPLLLLVPVAVFIINQALFAGKLKQVAIAAISAVLIYIFSVNSVPQIETAVLDITGISAAAPSDSGYAPLLGALYAAGYFLALWLILSACAWFSNGGINKSA